jgi:trans-2,3-dihydro-3-hydroxyanthranilate isomerase
MSRPARLIVTPIKAPALNKKASRIGKQMKYPFFLVDAFSSTPLSGNPCAVVLNSDALIPETMLAIAREMNQSETAFLMHSENCDLKARYFTPEREIPLAGHPTIAAIHAALEAEIISIPADQGVVTLELNDGPIRVEVERSGSGTLIRMFQRKPVFSEIHDPRTVLPLFGLESSDLLENACIQTVSAGTRQLMVPVRSHEALRKMELKAGDYRRYREKMGFFSPHLFCLKGVSPEATTFARHPGVPPDTAEDAFTGSATGAMAAYLWKYGLIREASFIAEQGHWMGRPGSAIVEIQGSREEILSVSVAGSAVTTVRGELTLS